LAVPLRTYIVDPLRLSRLRQHRLGDLADQLLTRLVAADQRPLGVEGAVVDLQDVLHRRHELGVGLRW
jgi:hypothetical protein